MKNATLAIALFAAMSVSACTHGGDWTPMSAGRTAGDGQIEQVQVKADKAFSNSLHK